MTIQDLETVSDAIARDVARKTAEARAREDRREKRELAHCCTGGNVCYRDCAECLVECGIFTVPVTAAAVIEACANDLFCGNDDKCNCGRCD